jgi:hypothetical protein
MKHVKKFGKINESKKVGLLNEANQEMIDWYVRHHPELEDMDNGMADITQVLTDFLNWYEHAPKWDMEDYVD